MKAKMTQYKERVEQYLKEFLGNVATNEPQQMLYDAMNYSLHAGGKRLRPALCLEFCRALSGQCETALPFAAAVEMIHTYSLIHDDLPCMDNDDFRRGRPTNHKVYGEAMAILAGDALLTDAFLVASSATLNPEDIVYAINLLARYAGSPGMVGGQVLDMDSEHRELTEQEVLDIQSRKTGALIAAACVLGAIAGGATSAEIDSASRYAQYLGLAFQIRDDMLDVIGTQEEMGKGVGTDAAKNTFVRLYGLETCEKLVQEYTEKAIACLGDYQDAGVLVEIARSLTDRRV